MVKPHASNPRAVREAKHRNRKFYKENPLIQTPEQIEQAKHDQMMADTVAYADEVNAILTTLLAAEPTLNVLTAHVMAADIHSARKATALVESGELPAEQAYVRVGSFARWDWTVTMLAMGRLSEDWFAANVCHLWSGSDPDDTSVQNLRLWQRFWRRNGKSVIRDGRPLPKGGADGLLTVYRGGLRGSIHKGFAWTTDPKIARKFALGAGTRVMTPSGIVISGKVKPSQVLAFITSRGESEIIVDPYLVQGIRPVVAR